MEAAETDYLKNVFACMCAILPLHPQMVSLAKTLSFKKTSLNLLNKEVIHGAALRQQAEHSSVASASNERYLYWFWIFKMGL